MEYELLMVNISRDFGGYSASFRDSIGQYLIASWLRVHSFKAYVFSGSVEECRNVIRREIEEHHVPVIGFYAAADNVRVVGHAIAWIKQKWPHVLTTVGGPQAAALDLDFFRKTGNDFAMVGEGEIPMLCFLEAVIDRTRKITEVPSLVFLGADEQGKLTLYYNDCPGAVITDLDEIPYPSMEDSLAHNLRQGTMVGLITGRGCPNQCTFCYEGANAKNVRFRSIANVMEEIDYIQSINPRLRYISIYDDTFTLNPSRILQFCAEIRKRDLKWYCEGHITFVVNHRDVLRQMIDAGLLCIQFGIESGSDEVLKAYRKRTNRQMILEGVQICKEEGIHGITGNFIIGGAMESKETLEESRKLARELIFAAKGILELYVVYFAPYPNTGIVNEPGKYDMVLHPELMECNLNTMRSPVVETRSLTVEQIYEEKRAFEAYIREQYREVSKNPCKADVLQGLVDGKERIHLNPTWENCYLSQQHVAAFLEHCTPEEQTFAPEKYIIRTFEDLVPDGDCIHTEVGDFFGIEKEILLRATGILTAGEMAETFGVSVDRIREVFEKLNEQCFVYISEF